MSLFDQLIADPTAKRELLAELHPYDGSGVVTLYFSLYGFKTEPTDTPANIWFKNRIQPGLTISRSMYRGTQIGGRSAPDFGSLVLANTDGGLDYLRTYSFDGRSMVLKLGGTLSDGTKLGYSDYGVIFNGTASGDALVTERDVTIRLASKDALFDLPIQNSLYTGGALQLDGSSVYGSTSCPMPAGAMTVECWVYPSSSASTVKIFSEVVNGGSAGLRSLRFGTAGSNTPAFVVRNDAAAAFTLDSSVSCPAGQWSHVAGVIDTGAALLRIFVNGSPAGTLPTAGTFSTQLSNHAVGRSPGGGFYFDGRIDGLRVWSTARSAAQINNYKYVEQLGTETGLVGCWQFNEGAGSAVADAVGSHGMTLSGSYAWALGDWAPSSVAGMAKPLLYGEVLELEPMLVDPPNLVYQWHESTSYALQAVYDKALPLTPPFSLTATDISFTSGTKTIATTSHDFSSLVVGQQVTISGSAANSGDKTVASIATDGKSFVVTTALTTEASGPSVTVVTKSGTNGYTVDLQHSLFILTAPPAGRITCWARGDATGSGYVNTTASITRRIATRPGLLSDPGDLLTASFTTADTANGAPVGIYIRPDSALSRDELGNFVQNPQTVAQALDALAAGPGFFYGFTRSSGLFQVGRFAAPTGSAVASYDESTIVNSPIQVAPLLVPVAQVIVGYGRNYAAQDPSVLAGAVTPGSARYVFATNEWRYTYYPPAPARTANLLGRRMVVLSCFTSKADAYAEAVRIYNLYSAHRDIYSTPLHTQPLARDVNDEVTVKRARLGMDSGVDFVILGFDEVVTSGQIKETIFR